MKYKNEFRLIVWEHDAQSYIKPPDHLAPDPSEGWKQTWATIEQDGCCTVYRRKVPVLEPPKS